LRFTFSPRISFYGMVGGAEKDHLLNHSKGLIFPVRWNEPFGLAIIESLYYGCPVLATPYGSLPELIGSDVGFLSNKKEELVEVAKNIGQFSNLRCNEYARDLFNSKKMAVSYIANYEKILSGMPLNSAAPSLKVIQSEKFLDWR
jgi:glycosyltransferase involved in cell wall biosynthesis